MADDQNVAVSVDDELTQEAVVAEDGDTGDQVGDESGASTAVLIIKRGGVETEDRFQFQPPALIGRFDPAVGPIDVDLGGTAEGVYVSRKHAKITHEDGVWKITDLGSANGTFILRSDFERVEEAELADGDEIALGNARLVFRLEAASDPS